MHLPIPIPSSLTKFCLLVLTNKAPDRITINLREILQAEISFERAVHNCFKVHFLSHQHNSAAAMLPHDLGTISNEFEC